jgi:hypothetical protein
VNLRIFSHNTSGLAGQGSDVGRGRDRRASARPGVALFVMLGAQLMIILDKLILGANMALRNNMQVVV